MNIFPIAVLAIGLASGAALAQPPPAKAACGAEFDQFKKEWNAIALPTGSKPGARVTAPGGHSHSEMEVGMMMSHARLAGKLCKQGKDHEALLHMDMVRAWLKLPNIPHPISHKYQLK